MMTFAGGITGFLWSLVMILGMALPMILVIWAIFAVGGRTAQNRIDGPVPLEVLRTRLAKGEITLDDFQKLKEQIT